MRRVQDSKDFKEQLIKLIESEHSNQIREVCEAIRQMYDVELIDVIDEVLDGDDAEPYSAASKQAGCLHLCVHKQSAVCLLSSRLMR